MLDDIAAALTSASSTSLHDTTFTLGRAARPALSVVPALGSPRRTKLKANLPFGGASFFAGKSCNKASTGQFDKDWQPVRRRQKRAKVSGPRRLTSSSRA
jgi:hypothetical protein